MARHATYLLPRITGMLLAAVAAQAPAYDYDAGNGEEINEVCAGCHGEFGQGGKDGEYPRLAGQPAEFIAKQLHLFRQRSRPNLAMVEYVDHRQMPDKDIRDVSIYLAGIELQTKLPPVDENAPDFDAYERLLASKRLMQIPRAKGDIEKAKKYIAKSVPPAMAERDGATRRKPYPCWRASTFATCGDR